MKLILDTKLGWNHGFQQKSMGSHDVFHIHSGVYYLYLMPTIILDVCDYLYKYYSRFQQSQSKSITLILLHGETL